MERKVRRAIGYFLCGIFVLMEATESIAFLHEQMPASLTSHINQTTAVITALVGIILIFISRNTTEEATPAQIVSETAPLSTTIKSVVNPTINPTISPNITVINHSSAPAQQPQVHSPSPLIAKPEPRHNVQYIRLQECGNPALLYAACFENVLIPKHEVRTFNSVRVRTEYKNHTTGKTYLTVFPSAWAEGENDADEVYMEAGKPFYATIAMVSKGKWSAVEVIATRQYWGGTTYHLRGHDLPLGESIVVVTLIGDRGMSIDPENFYLNIKGDGTAEVRHVPGPHAA